MTIQTCNSQNSGVGKEDSQLRPAKTTCETIPKAKKAEQQNVKENQPSHQNIWAAAVSVGAGTMWSVVLSSLIGCSFLSQSPAVPPGFREECERYTAQVEPHTPGVGL